MITEEPQCEMFGTLDACNNSTPIGLVELYAKFCADPGPNGTNLAEGLAEVTALLKPIFVPLREVTNVSDGMLVPITLCPI
jgi:hypothetical protein